MNYLVSKSFKENKKTRTRSVIETTISELVEFLTIKECFQFYLVDS